MMAKKGNQGKKLNSKTVALRKRKRRRVLTFVRMARYGANNFTRNAWLTVAATAVMTITLLVIFGTFSIRYAMVDTIDVIRDSVQMSVYISNDTEEEQVRDIAGRIESLESVTGVAFTSPTEGREQFIQENRTDPIALDALNQSDPAFPWVVRVNLEDINDVSELQAFTENDEELAEAIDPQREPSFAGQRREAIQQIGDWINFADRAGLLASVVFIAISSLIVFNTIRMAIFNRREEIQMMKLIGAERSFIRGPFIVEAVVYGFIAAVLATGLGIAALYFGQPPLAEAGIALGGLIDMLTFYSPFVLLGMILIGAFIGVVSSLLATHRHLKV